MNNDFLLTICIPTYNRDKYLDSSLSSIFKQIDNDNKVQVVVSDNDSTDNTSEVIKKYLKFGNFKYVKQQTNVGMSKNILASVEHANGEYCWLIGDDDFILSGSIKKILELLSENMLVDFFYAQPKGFPMDKFLSEFNFFDTSQSDEFSLQGDLSYKFLTSWEELVRPKYSVIFMGELMAGIFRKSIWDSFKFDPSGEFLSNLETSYAHCVMYANTFFGKRAIYIETPVILALEGAREWIDRLGYILIVIIRDLLNLYEEKGISKSILKECYIEYVRISLPYAISYLYKKSKYKDKVNLQEYFIFLFKNPVTTFKAIGKLIIGSFKRNVRAVGIIVFPKSYEKIKGFILNKKR